MTELGYDERTDSFPTTNLTKLSTSAGIISDLSVTVVGADEDVWLEFYCPAMAVNAAVLTTSWFTVQAGSGTSAVGYRNWSQSTSGAGGSMRQRVNLLGGVSYTFKVGLCASAAATVTAHGAVTVGGVTTGAMFLRVTD